MIRVTKTQTVLFFFHQEKKCGGDEVKDVWERTGKADLSFSWLHRAEKSGLREVVICPDSALTSLRSASSKSQ